MSYLQKLSALLLLTVSLYTTAVSADWRDLLKDITEVGSEILSNDNSSSSLDYSTIISGLKEALSIGSERAIKAVSKPDGYLVSP